MKPSERTPTTVCRAGLARADITPPVGIYHRMWGAAKHDRATGVHRPLTATILYLDAADVSPKRQRGSDSQVFLALDHCLLWAQDMDEFLDHVCKGSGLNRDQISTCFSHTHGSGLMDRTRADLPGGDLIDPYLKNLADTVVTAIECARRDIQSAHISWVSGRCNLAAQRDFYDGESKQFVCGYNPGAYSDDTVLIGWIRDDNGASLGTIINYACHPTTLAWKNTLISPDYLGAMREVVESHLPGLCFFVQGASGDLGPKEGFVGDVQIADRNGRQLGFAVLSAIQSLPPIRTRFAYQGPVISGATLGDWAHVAWSDTDVADVQRWSVERLTIPLAYPPEMPTREQVENDRKAWQEREAAARQANDEIGTRDARAMVERTTRMLTRIRSLPEGEQFPMPVTIVRAGDAEMVFVEGELYQEFQLAIRRALPDRPILIGTLTNGSRCSYLPTRETYGKGIYQESIAMLAPGCLEALVDAVVQRIKASGAA